MSLISTHQKKKGSQKRKAPDVVAGKEFAGDNGSESQKINPKKKKKDEPKKKLSIPVEGQPFQRGHRLFGWHTNKHTNEQTLRPCEVIVRRSTGSIPVLDDEDGVGEDSSTSKKDTSSTTTTTTTTSFSCLLLLLSIITTRVKFLLLFSSSFL